MFKSKLRPFFIRCRTHSTSLTPLISKIPNVDVKTRKSQSSDSLHFSHKLKQNLNKYDLQLQYFEVVDSFFDGNDISVKNLLKTNYYDLKAVVNFLHLKDSRVPNSASSSSTKLDLIHLISNKNMSIQDFNGIVIRCQQSGCHFVRADAGVGLSRSNILELCTLSLVQLKKLCKAHKVPLSSKSTLLHDTIKALVENGIYPSKPIEASMEPETASKEVIPIGSRASMIQLYKQTKDRYIKLELGITKAKAIELLDLHEKGQLGPEMYMFKTSIFHPKLKGLHEIAGAISGLRSLRIADLRQMAYDLNINARKRYSKFDLIMLIGNYRLGYLPSRFLVNNEIKVKRKIKAQYYRNIYSEKVSTSQSKDQNPPSSESTLLFINSVNVKELLTETLKRITKQNNIGPIADDAPRSTYIELIKEYVGSGKYLKGAAFLKPHASLSTVMKKVVRPLLIDGTDVSVWPVRSLRILAERHGIRPSKRTERATYIEILRAHLEAGNKIRLLSNLKTKAEVVSFADFTYPQLRKLASTNHVSMKGKKREILERLVELSEHQNLIIPLFESEISIGEFKLSQFTRHQLYFLIQSNGVEYSGKKSSYNLSKVEMAQLLINHLRMGKPFSFGSMKPSR